MKDKPIGVTVGWDKKIHLMFKGGKILWGDADKYLYPEYWILGWDWPVHPDTLMPLQEGAYEN